MVLTVSEQKGGLCMKKNIKKLLSLIVAAIMLVTINMVAFATTADANNNLARGEQEAVDCTVSVILVDETEENNGQVRIIFEDVAGSAKRTLSVDPEEYKNGAIKTIVLQAPTTYNVTIQGVNEGTYLVDKMTRSKEISFSASAGEKDLVVAITSDSCVLQQPVVNSTVEDTQEDLQGTENTQIPAGDKNVSHKTSDKNMNDAYETFLEKVSFIADDPTWESFLNKYNLCGDGRVGYAANYVKSVEGGTVEEYKALSPFDKFLYSETYTYFYSMLMGFGMRDRIASFENYKKDSNKQATFRLMEKGKDYQIVQEALYDLAEVQIDYINQNDYAYNFVDGRSQLEETGDQIGTTDDEPILSAEEEQEIKEAFEEETSTEEKPGTYNFVAILLVVIAVVSLAVVVYLRKKKDMNVEH